MSELSTTAYSYDRDRPADDPGGTVHGSQQYSGSFPPDGAAGESVLGESAPVGNDSPARSGGLVASHAQSDLYDSDAPSGYTSVDHSALPTPSSSTSRRDFGPPPPPPHPREVLYFPSSGVLHLEKQRQGWLLTRIDADDRGTEKSAKNVPDLAARVGLHEDFVANVIQAISAMPKANVKFRLRFGVMHFVGPGKFGLEGQEREGSIHTRELLASGIGSPRGLPLDRRFRSTFPRGVAAAVESILKDAGFEQLSTKRDLMIIYYYDTALQQYCKARACMLQHGRVRITKISAMDRDRLFSIVNDPSQVDVDFRVSLEQPVTGQAETACLKSIVNSMRVELKPPDKIALAYQDARVGRLVDKVEFRRTHRTYRRNQLVAKVTEVIMSDGSEPMGWRIQLADRFLDVSGEKLYVLAMPPRHGGGGPPLVPEAGPKEFDEMRASLGESLQSYLEFGDRLARRVTQERASDYLG